MFRNVLLPFVSMIFINLAIPNVYWDYGWNKHKYNTKDFQFEKPKVNLKGFVLPSLSKEPYNAHQWQRECIHVEFEL
jgi:hypothetical protein